MGLYLFQHKKLVSVNELQTGEYELYILSLLQQAIQNPLNSKQTRKIISYQIAPFGNICRSVFKELLGIGEKNYVTYLNRLMNRRFQFSANMEIRG